MIGLDGVDFYHRDVINGSIAFQNLNFVLDYVTVSAISGWIELLAPGNYSLIATSFNDSYVLDFSVSVDSFFVIPPFVQSNSTIEAYLEAEIAELYLSCGSSEFSVNVGLNVISLINSDCKRLYLNQNNQSLLVTQVIDFTDDFVPSMVELNHPMYVNMSMFSSFDSWSVECDFNCEISSDHVFFVFYAPEVGLTSIEVTVNYKQSSFTFELSCTAIAPPLIVMTSYPYFSVIDDVFIELTISSTKNVSHSFYVNDWQIDDSHVRHLSDYHSGNLLTSSFQLNLSHIDFTPGRSDFELWWKNWGFFSQNFSNFTVFNYSFSTMDFVSVFESRDVLLISTFDLNNIFHCEVQGTFYQAETDGNILICQGIQITTFLRSTELSVWFNNIIINSCFVSGEAFLEEICFLPLSSEPLISDLSISSSIHIDNTDLIVDGARCCATRLSDCGVFLMDTIQYLLIF
ncbi:hypothetical protein GEMRC1_011841 [Eukaryota sp. GEM-RC1]